MSSRKIHAARIRALRLRRQLTQEELAARSTLSADTIRRLESGAFSPSLDTLTKLCSGLDVQLSTFFRALELGAAAQPAQELRDLLGAQSAEVQALAFGVLRQVFEHLDRLREMQSSPTHADNT